MTGRLFSLLIVLSVLIAMPVVAQKGEPRCPNDSFIGEDLVCFRNLLPEKTLKALLKRKEVHEALSHSPHKQPAKLFHAARVHLHSPDQTDLIVVGESPVSGADNTWFWIIQSYDKDPQVILWSGCNVLDVSPKHTNSYSDITTTVSTASIVIDKLFKFDGQKYKLVKRTESENRQ